MHTNVLRLVTSNVKGASRDYKESSHLYSVYIFKLWSIVCMKVNRNIELNVHHFHRTIHIRC